MYPELNLPVDKAVMVWLILSTWMLSLVGTIREAYAEGTGSLQMSTCQSTNRFSDCNFVALLKLICKLEYLICHVRGGQVQLSFGELSDGDPPRPDHVLKLQVKQCSQHFRISQSRHG